MSSEHLTKRQLPKLMACLTKDSLENLRSKALYGLDFLDAKGIRRRKLPLHECLILELRESGFYEASDYLHDIIFDNIQLLAEDDIGIVVDLRKKNDYLEHISGGFQRAERFRDRGNVKKECFELLNLARFYAEQGKGILWLADKFFLAAIAISSKFLIDGGRMKGCCKFHYAKFLLDKFPGADPDEPFVILTEVRDAAIGKGWPLHEEGSNENLAAGQESELLFCVSAVQLHRVLLDKSRAVRKEDTAKSERLARLAERRARDGRCVDHLSLITELVHLNYTLKIGQKWHHVVLSALGALPTPASSMTSMAFSTSYLPATWLLENIIYKYHFVNGPPKWPTHHRSQMTLGQVAIVLIADDTNKVAEAIIEIGICQLMMNNLNNARRTFERAFKIHTKSNNIEGLCETRMHMAAVMQRLGDHEAAARLLTEMGAMAMDHGLRRQLGRALHLLGELHLRREKPELGTQHLAEAFACFMGFTWNPQAVPTASFDPTINSNDNDDDLGVIYSPEKLEVYKEEAEQSRLMMAISAGQEHMASYFNLIRYSGVCAVSQLKTIEWKLSNSRWWVPKRHHDLMPCMCPTHNRTPLDILRKRLDESKMSGHLPRTDENIDVEDLHTLNSEEENNK